MSYTAHTDSTLHASVDLLIQQAKMMLHLILKKCNCIGSGTKAQKIFRTLAGCKDGSCTAWKWQQITLFIALLLVQFSYHLRPTLLDKSKSYKFLSGVLGLGGAVQCEQE